MSDAVEGVELDVFSGSSDSSLSSYTYESSGLGLAVVEVVILLSGRRVVLVEELLLLGIVESNIVHSLFRENTRQSFMLILCTA